MTGRLPSCEWAGPRGSVLLSMSLKKVLLSGDVRLASFGLTSSAFRAGPEGMAPPEQLPLKLSKWGQRRETLQSGHFLSLQLSAEEEISPRGFVWSACVRSHSLTVWALVGTLEYACLAPKLLMGLQLALTSVPHLLSHPSTDVYLAASLNQA